MDNFFSQTAGRILVLWDPTKVDLQVLEATPQVIHCNVTCKVTSIATCISFVFAFHSIVTRRPLWSNIVDFGADCPNPWLILGDFNNVLKYDERCNRADVNAYDCCLNASLSDLRSIGCFFTWNKNSQAYPRYGVRLIEPW